MKRTLFTLVVGLCFIVTAQAQNYAKKLKKSTGITVTYRSVYKGKVYPGGTMMLVSGDQVKLQNLSPEGKIVEPKANTLRQDTYIDYSRRLSYRRAVMPNNEVVYTNAPFEYGEGFTDVKTEKYLGLNCKVVRTVVNSNTIDVWYTNDLAFRGTPQTWRGVPDGLVLRVVRNGDSVQEAVDIKALKDKSPLLPSDWGHYLDYSNYSYAINQSGVISVPVFDQQTICFNGAKLPETLVPLLKSANSQIAFLSRCLLMVLSLLSNLFVSSAHNTCYQSLSKSLLLSLKETSHSALPYSIIAIDSNILYLYPILQHSVCAQSELVDYASWIVLFHTIIDSFCDNQRASQPFSITDTLCKHHLINQETLSRTLGTLFKNRHYFTILLRQINVGLDSPRHR